MKKSERRIFLALQNIIGYNEKISALLLDSEGNLKKSMNFDDLRKSFFNEIVRISNNYIQ